MPEEEEEIWEEIDQDFDDCYLEEHLIEEEPNQIENEPEEAVQQPLLKVYIHNQNLKISSVCFIKFIIFFVMLNIQLTYLI